MKPGIFFKGHHGVIDHLLNKPTNKTFIASSPEDENQIFGYLSYEPNPTINDQFGLPQSLDRPLVHFAYVKDNFRGMGVAKSLFSHANLDPNKIYFTHWTIPVDDLIRKWEGMIYDPYKL